jgi:hypothetical protein
MSYQGTAVTIPIGDLGILTDRPASDVPPNALIMARNITLEKGWVEKAAGTLAYNDNALTAGIVALFDWWPDSVKQRLIAATSDGSLWRDTGDRGFSLNTAIATGLTSLGPNSMFVEGGAETAGNNKKLFFLSDGFNQIKVLDGDAATFTDMANPATDWATSGFPTVGLIHRNRFWVFAGQRAYASNTGDHEEFTSSFLTQNIFPGEGGDVRGAYVFKGRMFAFKDGGFVYYLDDSASDSSTWFWKKLAGNFGLAGPHSIMDALNDMLAGNTTGTVTSYSASQKLGDIESADIFRNAEMENHLRENSSKTGVTEQHAVYYAEKKQAFFTYRTSVQLSNDGLICIDINKANPRITLLPKGTPQCLGLRKDTNMIQRPMYGDAAGFVQLMDYEDRLEGATAYTGEFQTPYLDFRFADSSLAHKQKHFDYLGIEFAEAGDWNVTCDVYIDGVFKETINFEQQLAGNQLDAFLLDTDRLAQPTTQGQTKRLHGTGRRISLHFKNSGSRESFQIASYTIGFRASGEQASKF